VNGFSSCISKLFLSEKLCRHTHDALIVSKRFHDPNGSDPGKQKLHEIV
jgi:hypothetical protein